MARNRARYAQRTERQRLHDAHQKRMARGASPAAGEYGGLSVINSAAQRLENKVLLIQRPSYVDELLCYYKNKRFLFTIFVQVYLPRYTIY